LKIKNLFNNPLFLDIEDKIVFKIRARNINGWSNFSLNNGTASVKSKPQVRVSNFQLGEKTTKNSIHITWSPIDSSPSNGGVSLVDYKVYWCKSERVQRWTVLAESTNYQSTVET
jgi:hypothetical protein